MKAIAITYLVLLCSSFAFSSITFKQHQKAVSQARTKQVDNLFSLAKVNIEHERAPNVDMCPFCVDFMDEAIDQLLNAILNGGVVGGCTEVCALLVNPVLVLGCNLVCDYVGIDAFIDAINVTDPDPIFICQDLDLCPIVTGGAVKIVSAVVNPPKGPSGTTFSIELTYSVTSPTGPGLLAVDILPPDAEALSDAEFSEGQPVGKYLISWTIDSTPSEQEPFDPGFYDVGLAVCEGDCTTDHPNGGVYASANTSFIITSS